MIGRIVVLVAAALFTMLGVWYLRNATKYQGRTLHEIAQRRGIWRLFPPDWAASFVQRPWFIRQAHLTGYVAVGVGVLLLILLVLSVIAEGWNPQ